MSMSCVCVCVCVICAICCLLLAVSELLVGPASPILGSVLVGNSSSFPFVGEYSFAVRGRAAALVMLILCLQFWVYLMWVDTSNHPYQYLPVFAKANGWGDAMNPYVYLEHSTYVGPVIGEPCMSVVLLRRLTVMSSCAANAYNGISLSVATQVWTHVSFAHGANGVMQASGSACSAWRC